MIKDNLLSIQAEIPSTVKLVAVSKLNSIERILEAYKAGQRVFGENRVQELMPKYEALPKDIEWHLIGHLQTNKVKYIAPFISMIQSIDSLKLLIEVNKEAQKNNRVINVLLQFHVAEEETKFGLNKSEAYALLQSDEFQKMEYVNIAGIMGMASNTDNDEQIKREFQLLKQIFNELKQFFFTTSSTFKELSMGMSSDYQEAILEGSTIIRVGSKIFK